MIPEDPSATRHAERRWRQRATYAGEYQPSEAWHDGAPIPITETSLEGDGARYHAPTETVLIRRDGAIVTVLDALEGKGRRAAWNAEWDDETREEALP
jgi:hypothetical protein